MARKKKTDASPTNEPTSNGAKSNGTSNGVTKAEATKEAAPAVQKAAAPVSQKVVAPPVVPQKANPPAAPQPTSTPAEEAPAFKKTRRGGGKKNKQIVETTAGPSRKQSAILKAAELTIRSVPKKIESSHRSELNSTIQTLQNALASEVAKRPKAIRPSSKIQREIDELRNIEDMKDFMEEKKQELEITVQWEAYHAFKTKATELVEKATEMAKQAGPPSQDVINKERMVQKLSVVKKVPVAKIDADAVKQRIVEVPSEALALMGPPTLLSRRYEKEYGVAIELGGKGRGKGVSGRGVGVIGYDEDLDEAVAKLNSLDFSVTKKITLKPNELPKVIGPGGKSIRELEKQTDAILVVNNIDGTPNKEVVIYGDGASVAGASQAIEKIQAEVLAEGKTSSFTYKGEKAAFLFKDNGANRKKEILAEHEVTLRMQSGDHQTEFVFKGKSDDAILQAKEKIFSYIDSLHVDTIETTEEKLSKFFKTPDLRQQYDRLTIDEKASVLFLRKVSSITLVSDEAAVADKAAAKVKDLIAFASYEPILIPILREQARVFNRENCEEVGYRSGCTVQLHYQDLKLCVKGSEEQLAKAKKYIQEVIDREGSVESMELSEAVTQQLMSRGFAQKREIEDSCLVSLNVDRAANSVTFVGSKIGNKRAREMVEELEKLEKLMETKVVPVKAEEIPRIIGTRGANLRQIRDVCPTVTVVDGEETGSTPSVTLRGTASQIEEAERMLQDLCNRESEVEVVVEQKPVQQQKQQKPKAVKMNFESEDLFPTLGAVMKPQKMKRGKGKGKGRVQQPEPAVEEEYIIVERPQVEELPVQEEEPERPSEVTGNE